MGRRIKETEERTESTGMEGWSGIEMMGWKIRRERKEKEGMEGGERLDGG